MGSENSEREISESRFDGERDKRGADSTKGIMNESPCDEERD